MKKQILTLFAVVAIAGVAGQVKKPLKIATDTTIKYSRYISLRTSEQPGWISFQNGEKRFMVIDAPVTTNRGVDSVIIHVKKRQLTWLNDSTLTVKP